MAVQAVTALLLDKLDVGTLNPDECWPWTGACSPAGYGRLPDNTYVHRKSYELHVGPIPEGLFVCHACDNPPCGNPWHLFLGSSAENAQDMARKGRVGGGAPKGVYPSWTRDNSPHIQAHEAGTCLRGHPASEAYRRKHGPRVGQWVYCRACKREAG